MAAEFVDILLNDAALTAEKGTLISTVLEPAHAAALVCGGKGICRKCRVQAFGALSAPTAEETACFTQEELQAGWRLACRTRIEGPCRIYYSAQQISQICAKGTMPAFEWQPTFEAYGAAIDIGTTTLALHLYNRHSLLAEITAPNPQAAFGADVISRITCCLEGKGPQLATCIRQALAQLLEQAAAVAGIAVTQIDKVVITGNTAMLYLLTERNVSCLSRAPFQADHLFGETVPAHLLQLPCANAQVYLCPCISAFVGSDMTTVLLCTDADTRADTVLIADIGTNGEMALLYNNRLLCCSTAAGPAFEGAGLSMGMPGKAGAIDKVRICNGQPVCSTIENAPPVGICGSGVIDAIACLLELELLDETGILEDDPMPLAGNVCLNGKDIRMIQLAKGAIRAGMETMLQHAGISAHNLDELAIAGGFGSYLHIPSAQSIGLVPPMPVSRVRVLGNAALVGADIILLQKGAAERAAAIARTAETVELSSNAVFQEQFMAAMFFGDA